MADWGKNDKVVTDDWGKADVEVKAPVAKPATPKEAPGWFQPGSKSEAFVRGASQGATLGFGDEIQALIRRVAPEAIGGAPKGQTYEQIRDEERAANNRSSSENSGSYLAGNIAASLPTAAASVGAIPAKLGLAKAGQVAGQINTPLRVLTGQAASKAGTAAIGGGIVGGVSGLGAGEGSVGDQLTSTAVGAGTGALLSGALAKTGRGATAAVQSAKTAIADPGKDTAVGALIGAGAALASGQDPLTGAIIGGAGGRAGMNQLARGAIKALPNKAGAVASRAIPIAQATSMALMNMSNQQTRAALNTGNQKIEAAVAAGKPSYAATFSELQTNPEFRTATMAKEDLFDDENEDE